MNEEEKKSIEDMNRFANGIDMSCVTARQMQIILNLVEKLQKENEEKNKIVDSMIKVMIENSICDYFIKEKCKNYAGENGKTCNECIKQYFENKVKEVE